MPKNARLSKDIDAIELGFVEREATPKFAMKLGIQMHLAGLSLSNTVSVLESLGVKKSEISERTKIFDFRRVERVRSTVHNWVSLESVPYGRIRDDRVNASAFTRHKPDLQPDDDMNPNQVAVDETVIRLNNDLYWLYIGYQKSATSGWQTRASLLFRRSIQTLTTFYIRNFIQQETTIQRKILCWNSSRNMTSTRACFSLMVSLLFMMPVGTTHSDFR